MPVREWARPDRLSWIATSTPIYVGICGLLTLYIDKVGITLSTSYRIRSRPRTGTDTEIQKEISLPETLCGG